MGMTYTPNLHLGLQEDKRDYLNWDAITQNWKTLDKTSGSGSGNFATTRVKLNNPMTAGHFETLDIPVSALLSANLGDEIGAGLTGQTENVERQEVE